MPHGTVAIYVDGPRVYAGPRARREAASALLRMLQPAHSKRGNAVQFTAKGMVHCGNSGLQTE